MPLDFAFTDVLGLCLLMFGAIWLLYGGYLFIRDKQKRLSGILVALVAIIGIGVFIFLTASTVTRRAYINLDMHGLFIIGLEFLAAGVLAAAAAYGIYQLGRQVQGQRVSGLQFGIAASVCIALLMGVIIYYLYTATFAPDLDEQFIEVVSVEGITVHGGYPIRLFENVVVKAPTAMTLGPQNELYVAGTNGTIWVMDDNGNGSAENVRIFADNLDQPQGLAWGNDGLYVNVQRQTLFLQDTDADGAADETTVIVDGFPGEIYAFHQNSGLTFGPDGRLYIGSAATTDNEEETNPMAARIFSVNPDGSDLQVYATGTRNPFGIIPAPNGGFFAVENGSSGCIPDTDCKELIDVPEEVNYILEGHDYGFPDYYGMPAEDSGTMPPVATFSEHSAPAGLLIYDGDKLPSRFKGQLFVSLWAAGEIYRIQLYKLDEEHYIGSPLIFVEGIPGPTAILNTPDGGIYVASYSGNAIYYIG